MSDSESAVLVIDNGSGKIRAGFNTDDKPNIEFPSIVGHSQQPGKDDCFVGNEAQTKRSILSLKHPIERGIITDWENMEKIWHHTYSELKVSSSDYPVLLTDAPHNPIADREKMTQIMFEKFNTPAMYPAIQPVLSLYVCGLVHGTVIESGYGLTHAVPVHEGLALYDSIRRIEIAGQDLTEYLKKLLTERGHSFAADAQNEDIVNEIKEKLCYTAQDFKQELESATSNPTSVEKSYKLPDGQTITVGSERFECPEILFQPDLFSVESSVPGIHKAIHDSIVSSEQKTHKDLYSHVVLSGGNTLFPGIDERLKKELTSLFPSEIKTKVHAPPERKYTVWKGGVIIASLPTFSEMSISKKEYEETGASVVRRII